MQIVQIQISVSEIGQVGCLFCQDQILGVAAETEFVVLLAEGRIKLGGILLCQKAEVFATVCGMAAAAVVLRNRTVQEFFAFEFSGKGRQHFILTQLLGLVMAGQAETLGILFQQELHGRGMRGVAVHAAVNITHYAVLVHGVFSNFLDILMASVAQKRCEVLDHL